VSIHVEISCPPTRNSRCPLTVQLYGMTAAPSAVRWRRIAAPVAKRGAGRSRPARDRTLCPTGWESFYGSASVGAATAAGTPD